MKYIVLEVTDLHPSGTTHKRELPVIFPNEMVHSHVAQALTKMLRSEKPDGRMRQIRSVSAGEISSMAFEEGCHGRSTTLNLASREHVDDVLIKGHDYFHGLVD